MQRRDVILAGALLMAQSAIPMKGVAAEGGGSDLDTAMGIPGPSVSADEYVEILQLYNRYCHAVDMGSGEAFADTFTEDGEFVAGRPPGRANDVRTPVKGRAELTKFASRGGSRHFTANLVVTKTPEGAKASSYLLLYSARTIPHTFTEIAIYDDTLVRTPAGWRFKRRVVWRDDDDITPFRPWVNRPKD